MAGAKKRKHTSVEEQLGVQATQQNITAFGNVRKSHGTDGGQKKRKTTHQREGTPPRPPIASTRTDRKRKRGLETAEEDVDEGIPIKNPVQQGIFEEFASGRNNATPRKKRSKNIQPPPPADTPSKSAVALFDNLKLDAILKASPFPINARQQGCETPPDTPEAENGSDQLPKELEDLMHLHAAFLSALSLYYAHNGTSSPANIKALLPMVTKHWKKRRVTLDDLRLILAIGLSTNAGFVLRDFGRAGVCLTKLQPPGRAVKHVASYVEEKELKAAFEYALQKNWIEWLASAPKENRHPTVFLHQLPLADVEKDDSVDKAAPLFTRGQHRLADLKASQDSSKSESNVSSEIAAEQKTVQAVQNRGMSLLDRILAKQALTTSLPTGPTKVQMERKAALQRVEEIARVLDLLAAGRSRCSFSMQVMAQQLRQSLRNPISREEVERCLDLMTKEITPGFVSLVKSGPVTGVVVTKGGKVGREELSQRVELAAAK